MVFHDQEKDIAKAVEWLEERFSDIGYKDHCLHTGPLIRQEEPYRFEDLIKRKQLLKAMREFIRKVPIDYVATLAFDKNILTDQQLLLEKIRSDLEIYSNNRLKYFYGFDKIILYYDEGQKESTRIAHAVFKHLLYAETRRIQPKDYRLFQLADLVYTLEPLELKRDLAILLVEVDATPAEPTPLPTSAPTPAPTSRPAPTPAPASGTPSDGLPATGEAYGSSMLAAGILMITAALLLIYKRVLKSR